MDIEELKLQIHQWFELDLDLTDHWDPIIEQLVPAPPLMTELSGPDLTLDSFDPRVMAEKVGHDAVLGARILAVANSAKFGLSQSMTSIQRAMVHLGFNMVRSTIINYLLESRFSKPLPIPAAHMQYVRQVTAGASVLAFRWGMSANLRDPSTAATLALLGKIGLLLLGCIEPRPGESYRMMPTEIARLSFEHETWGITSPTLGAELARRWDVPNPIPRLIDRIWEPLLRVVSPDPLDPDPPILTLVAASLAIVDHHLRDRESAPMEVLDADDYKYLKHNVGQHNLSESLTGVWNSARVRRELETVIE